MQMPPECGNDRKEFSERGGEEAKNPEIKELKVKG